MKYMIRRRQLERSMPSYLNCPNRTPMITIAKMINNPINNPFNEKDIAFPLENPMLLKLRFSILAIYK